MHERAVSTGKGKWKQEKERSRGDSRRDGDVGPRGLGLAISGCLETTIEEKSGDCNRKFVLSQGDSKVVKRD
jgi:hypothetical protein